MKPALNLHLSDDQLLDRLYGLGESELPHLRECEECSSRMEALERRRAEVVAASPMKGAAIPNEFLLSQRRAIYARLEQPSSLHARWAPAVIAAAFLLVMGVFLSSPNSIYRPWLPTHPTSGKVVAAQAVAPSFETSGSEKNGSEKTSSEESGVEKNDEQLFSDLYSMEQSVEPRAAAPIHGLFESSAGDTAR
jgi:hypothetical protein